MTTDLTSQRLGEFEVVRELGRGGMGVVYEARQLSLGRRVALKVLGTGLGLTPRAVERFRTEAAAAAKLHHTNIVPVYSTGEERGLYFYAMELIDGPALDVIIGQLRDQSKPDRAEAVAPDLTTTAPHIPNDLKTTPVNIGSTVSMSADHFARMAAMIAEVADALHHAHQNGVTHRDIKPSNLLWSSDGRLSITDFGLARMLEQPGMTMTGEFVGTPAYMSPEQITAGRIPVDHRTDLYSLGATLYEWLTLRPPFAAQGRDRMLALVIQKEPAPPRSVNPNVPRDLETICLKCLEKDPDRRYANAKELADDLRRFVNGFAIHAKRTGPLGRAKKWMIRNPALAGAAVAVLLGVCTAGGFAWQAYQTEQRRLTDKQAQAIELQAHQRDAALDKALTQALGGDLAGAERWIGEAELAGASAGDVRLMRGQIAYCRGDFATAIEQLEQAIKLQPHRAAPLALLTAAHTEFGSFERYYELKTQLASFTPVAYEDYLFMGLAESFEKPERGLAAMDEAIRRRDSSVSRALRARARSLAAMGNGNWELANQAVEDARIAVAMLPNDPFALAQGVMANLVVAGVGQQIGKTEEQQAALARAGRDVRGLEHLRHVPIAATARLYYFRHIGDHVAALAEVLARSNSGVRMSLLEEGYVAIELYHNGRFQEALDVLDRSIARGGDPMLRQLYRCFVLAELSDGPARALAAIPPSSMLNVFSCYLPVIKQLLGRSREAVVAFRTLREQFKTSPARNESNTKLLEFGSGEMSAEQLLTAAGTSRLDQCEAHFFIGMARLAEGDRATARTHFQRAADTRVVWYVDYTWSVAFLSRLDADPEWPRWIPQRNPKP